MTPEDWLEAGYKKYPSPHNNADFLLQKCVRDGEGRKKYYVDVYVYDWAKYWNPVPYQWGFAPEMRLEDPKQQITGVTIQLNMTNNDTVADVEAMMEKFWAFVGIDCYAEGEMK
jgi:hypothetical protein